MEKKKKIGIRRKSRILALNALYLIDIGGLNIQESLNSVFIDEKVYSDDLKRFASFLVIATIQNLSLIDEIIKKYLQNWSLERLAVVDRNILRLASCEFLCCPETPVSVIIDEAIEIAKEYSTKDSGRFVNGVLDKVKLVREDKEIMGKFVLSEELKKCKKLIDKEVNKEE